MRGKKQNVRLWAVVFWLVVWQVAAMALHTAYPHGTLLLPSPLAALARLMALAGTAAIVLISALFERLFLYFVDSMAERWGA